jgi:hypothetical protein
VREPEDLVDLAERTDLAKQMLAQLPKFSRSKDVLAMLANGAPDAALKKAGVLRTDKAHVRAFLGFRVLLLIMPVVERHLDAFTETERIDVHR